MSSQRDLDHREPEGSNRRSFLQSSGVAAAGAAALVVPASAMVAPAAAGASTAGRPVTPTGDVPPETVMAYVHDADRGHVTIVSGKTEQTYHDPALVQRLLAASRAQTAS